MADDKENPIVQLEAELETLSVEYDSIENQIRAASPRYAALTAPQSLTLAAVQQAVLGRETALLEYSLGDERSYLWVVTDESVNLFKLPARSEIERQAQDLRAQLVPAKLQRRIVGVDAQESVRALELKNDPQATGSVAAFAAASNILYKTALEAAAEIFGGKKRLLVVADGALNYIPFEALVTAPGGDDYASLSYLIQKNEIVYAPSASVVALIRGQKMMPTGKDMLLVADPVFSSTDPRARDTSVSNAQGAVSRTGISSDTRGLGLSSALTDVAGVTTDSSGAFGGRLFPLARLSGTRREADSIARLVRGSGGRAEVWMDLEANETSLETRDMKDYRVIHFATHGMLNSERPQFSGLILSQVGNENDDGFLRTNEIFNLRLGSSLVMLSASETGLGKEKRGEGVNGLTRAFMYAGAPTVGVSLWSVADTSTAELMTDIYKRMFTGEGVSAVAAKRAAQTAMIQSKRYSAPFYWAPFVLAGEWSDASLASRTPAQALTGAYVGERVAAVSTPVLTTTPTPTATDSTTTVERYPSMEYPDPVIAESKFDLLVSLTVNPGASKARVESGDVTKSGAMKFPTDKEIEVVLIAPDFVFLDSNSSSLILKKDGDSTPARFKLQAKAIQGAQQTSKIYATLWLAGGYLGKISRDVTVVQAKETLRSPSGNIGDAPAPAQPASYSAEQPMPLNLEVKSADLTVTIYDSPNTHQPEILISSPWLPKRKPESFPSEQPSGWLNLNYSDFFKQSAQRADLSRSAGTLANLAASLKGLSLDFLRGFGRRLYREFAPESFKKAFWEVYKKRGANFKTIQIFSDNMELPWELMIPVSSDSTKQFEFLGVEFAIGRWHFSRTAAELDPPPQTLSLDKLILIAPVYPKHKRLPSQEAEIKTLREIEGSEMVRGKSDDIRTLFQQFPQGMIHFAGHGTIVSTAQNVYRYSIQLEDGPLELTAWQGITKSRDNHPLLFFNACDIGQTHKVANFIDGWAPAVLEEGAGGYIGALWPVSDEGAAGFGIEFYQSLDRQLKLGPTSIAEVVKETRRKFLDNGDPTFLAYVYYGDANLKLIRRLR